MLKKSKKIIHVVQHLRPGGIEVLALNMLKQSKGNVFIVSLEGTEESAISDWEALVPYIDHITFLNKKPGVSVRTILQLCRIYRQRQADVVHTHHIGPLLYGGLSAKLSRIKTIVHTEHDAWHLRKKKSRKLQNILLKMVSPKIIADAHHVSSELKKFFPSVSPEIIHNGIDTKIFKPFSKERSRQYLGLPTEKQIIGCAARLEEVKGHNVLLAAFSKIQDKDMYLALAGEGSLKKRLQEQACALGVEDRVIFLGHVNDMNMFYNAIDVFCLASYQEGFPLSPLEAQACGVPCVLSNVGGCGETIHEHTGILVEAGNVTALAHNLKNAFLLRNAVKIRGTIKKISDLSIMNKKYNEVYTSC